MLSRLVFYRTDRGHFVTDEHFIKYDLFRGQVVPYNNEFLVVVTNGKGFVVEKGLFKTEREAKDAVKDFFTQLGMVFRRKRRKV